MDPTIVLRNPKVIKKNAKKTNSYETKSKNQNIDLTHKNRKLDEETENFIHEKVSLSLSKKIQQARLAKGMSQKDLATKINVKPNVIQEYESGKAIPDNKILRLIKKYLNLELHGKGISK
tara:strand:- start:7063 stop:7422 length:360 start_codon:yes stop_codon:yes gene_type:complete